MAFLFVFFWDFYDSNVGASDIVPDVSEVVFISFNYFFLFSSLLHLFPPFYLPLNLSSASVILLLVPSRLLLISVIALFRRRQWHPTPVLVSRKSHGRRSLVGCSSWGR